MGIVTAGKKSVKKVIPKVVKNKPQLTRGTSVANGMGNSAFEPAQQGIRAAEKTTEQTAKEMVDDAISESSEHIQRLATEGAPIQKGNANFLNKKRSLEMKSRNTKLSAGKARNLNVDDILAQRQENFSNPLNSKIYNSNKDAFNVKNIRAQYTDEAKFRENIQSKVTRKMTGKESDVAIQRELNANLYNKSMNPTVVDKFKHSKAPKAIVAGGATAFLVSRMSASKGQMSNNQLYGQSGGY